LCFFYLKEIVKENADLPEFLIESLADRDDIIAVNYWSKS
jgi:hypothetical protein